MATEVPMVHRQTGITKNGFYGFSWTSFFFGGFPALIRGDLAYGLGILAVGLLAAAFSAGLLWFVVTIIWAFIYNRNYTQRLLENGYEFAGNPESVAKAQRALDVQS
jgi:hypothetical protein